MSEKTKVINDSIYYIAAVYLLQITSFILGIFNRKYLGTEMTGILVYCNIWFNYLTLSHFGVIDAGHKEIPFYIGKKDLIRANLIKDNMYSYSVIISLIIMVAGITYIFIFSGMQIEYKIGFLSVFIRLPFQMLTASDISYFRSENKFNIISSASVFITVLNVLLTFTLIKYFQLYGAYLSLLLLIITNFLFYRIWTRKNLHSFLGFKFKIDKREIYHLLKTGLPLAVYGLLFSLIISVDSLLVNHFKGATSLGIYNLAVMMNTAIYTIPSSFSSIMFPRFQEIQGIKGETNSLKNYFIKPITVFGLLLLPFTIGVTYLILPSFVLYALPNFSEGILPARILLAGTFFLGLVQMPIIFLITINKEIKIIIIQIATILINIILNIYLVNKGYGLNTIAGVTALSYFIFFLILYNTSIREFNEKEGLNKLCLFILLVFAIGSITIYVIGNLKIIENSAINIFIQIILLILILLPNYFYVEHKTKVFQTILKQLPWSKGRRL